MILNYGSEKKRQMIVAYLHVVSQILCGKVEKILEGPQTMYLD